MSNCGNRKLNIISTSFSAVVDYRTEKEFLVGAIKTSGHQWVENSESKIEILKWTKPAYSRSLFRIRNGNQLLVTRNDQTNRAMKWSSTVSVRVCTQKITCTVGEIIVQYEDTRLPPVFLSPRNLIFDGEENGKPVGLYSYDLKMSDRLVKVNQAWVWSLKCLN